jgi:hypothetical protein
VIAPGRAVGYLLLGCALAQCASLGRRASIIAMGVAARLAPGEVRIHLHRSFLEAHKNRVTIQATMTVDESSGSANPDAFDGDLHFAGRAPEIGLRLVGEIKNADEADSAVALVLRAASTRRPLELTGAWRIWAEHSLGRTEEQGRPLNPIQTPHVEHVFEIHPVTRLSGIDLLGTLHPVEGYKPGSARRTFEIYQEATYRLKATPTTIILETPTWLYNDVHFLMELTGAPQEVVADGRFVTASALDMEGNVLVERLRIVFVEGSPPERAVRSLGRGARLHVWGIPRLNFAEISRRAAESGNSPDFVEGPLAYEIVVVGVYPTA